MRDKLTKKDVGFAQIKNEIICSTFLSWKAKGIYAYLYSKPDDWDFSADRIRLEGIGDRKTILNGLKELEEYGLLERKRLGNGRVEYHITYEPKVLKTDYGSEEPKSENATVAFRHGGKNGLISNKEFITNKESLTNKEVSPEIEPEYEEIEDRIPTTSPTRKFLNQRREESGRPPIQPRKMTTNQEINFNVLKLLTHYRERVQEEHRELHILEKRDDSRNKKIAKLLRSCYEFFSFDDEKIKEMIEWWIEGNGEWCNYRPENCFMTTTCEDFMNREQKEANKKEKEDHKGKWKCEYGHWHEKGQECGHGLQRQMEARSSQFANQLGEKFKINK